MPSPVEQRAPCIGGDRLARIMQSLRCLCSHLRAAEHLDQQHAAPYA